MMVICHSYRLLSSTRPAEKPSTGRLSKSAAANLTSVTVSKFRQLIDG